MRGCEGGGDVKGGVALRREWEWEWEGRGG